MPTTKQKRRPNAYREFIPMVALYTLLYLAITPLIGHRPSLELALIPGVMIWGLMWLTLRYQSGGTDDPPERSRFVRIFGALIVLAALVFAMKS